MEYGMDQMHLGDLELFPECLLFDENIKDGARDIFQDPAQSGGIVREPAPSLADDAFPDWLDLKMDLSLLEGLETTDTVLDDLLLGEVTEQSLDILPAPQIEDKTLTPLDFEQLPNEQLPVIDHTQSDAFSSLGVFNPLQNTPPSSPDWIVPDLGLPSSPVSSLSPVSEPASPDNFIVSISPPPPASVPAETTILTFVAPIIQPVSIFNSSEISVGSQSLPLENILSLPVLIQGSHGNVPVVQLEVQSEAPSPASPMQVVEKPKRERKRRAAVAPKASSAKSRALSTQCESDSDESYEPAPTTKKERKRKQNKDAAMRYRVKKRMETDTLADEEEILMAQNKELTDKAQQLSNELKYLKNLMREMFKAKGLLK